MLLITLLQEHENLKSHSVQNMYSLTHYYYHYYYYYYYYYCYYHYHHCYYYHHYHYYHYHPRHHHYDDLPVFRGCTPNTRVSQEHNTAAGEQQHMAQRKRLTLDSIT